VLFGRTVTQIFERLGTLVHPKAFTIICRTFWKRKGPDVSSAKTSQDRQRRKLNPVGRASSEKPTQKLFSGNRPIITMVRHWADTQRHICVLLDTGCSVSLINQKLYGQAKIALLRYKEEIPLRKSTGKIVTGAGEFYT
jgi:hypothetical protein